MSQRPIDRSPDLKRLRDEGYNILVRDAYLLMRDVPYVNAAREIKRGVIVAALIPSSCDVDSRGGFPNRQKSESMSACWRACSWVQRLDCGMTLTPPA